MKNLEISRRVVRITAFGVRKKKKKKTTIKAALGPPDKASKQELTRSNKLLSNYYISEQRLKNKTAKSHETTSSGLMYVELEFSQTNM